MITFKIYDDKIRIENIIDDQVIYSIQENITKRLKRSLCPSRFEIVKNIQEEIKNINKIK